MTVIVDRIETNVTIDWSRLLKLPRLNNSGGRQSEGYGKQHHHQVKLNFKFRRFACIGNLGSAAPLASGASAAHVVGWGVPSYWIGCG